MKTGKFAIFLWVLNLTVVLVSCNSQNARKPGLVPPQVEQPFAPPVEQPFAPPVEQPFAPPVEQPFAPPGGQPSKPVLLQTHPNFFNIDEVNSVKIIIPGYGSCSGSFISTSHILTAAHVFLKKKNTTRKQITDFLQPAEVLKVNGNDDAIQVSFPTPINYFRNGIGVVNIVAKKAYIPHKFLSGSNTEYDFEHNSFDFAVLELESVTTVQPSKIITKPYEHSNQKLELAGYPEKSGFHKQIEVLEILTRKEVRDLFLQPGSLFPPLKEINNYVSSVILSKNTGNPRDFQGASGGPLYIKDTFKIVGTLQEAAADNIFFVSYQRQEVQEFLKRYTGNQVIFED